MLFDLHSKIILQRPLCGHLDEYFAICRFCYLRHFRRSQESEKRLTREGESG